MGATIAGVVWRSTDAPPQPNQLDLRAHAARKRYAVETGGIVWNGHIIRTDRESQSKLIAEFVAISASIRTEPAPWKFSDGFVSLTNAEMGAVIMAARTHVAASFATESDVVDGIEASTITTFAEIDAADWPSNA